VPRHAHRIGGAYRLLDIRSASFRAVWQFFGGLSISARGF
jgi:hypothetical protein